MRIDTAEGLMRRRDGNPRLRGAYRGYRKTHLSVSERGVVLPGDRYATVE